jgi:hypothetical protein
MSYKESFTESDMEDAIAAEPEKFLGEHGLKLVTRQYRVGPYIFDLLFEDRHGAKLIVELQLGTLDRNHTYKILDYYDEYKIKRPTEFIELMVAANRINYERRQRLSAAGINWRELPLDKFNIVGSKVQSADDSVADLNNMSQTNVTTKVKSVLSVERPADAEIKKELYYKDKQRHEFLRQLLERCRQKTNLFINVSPNSYQNWIAAGAGKTGLLWQFTVLDNSARVEFWLCTKSADINRKRYEFINMHKEDIKKKFGEALTWDFKERRINQCIRYYCPIGGLEKESNWEAIQDDLIGHLIKMESSLRDIIRRLE